MNASARTVWVSSAKEIGAQTWVAGDTLIMKSGIWKSQVIKLNAEGTNAKPVLLIAEGPRAVVLSGESRLEIGGKYAVVSGLWFKDGQAFRRNVIEFKKGTEDCRITNICIDSYNPEDPQLSIRWLSVSGIRNRIDHCSFTNKYHLSPTLVIELDTAVYAPSHRIDHNYFGYRKSILDENGKEMNGQETIRVGVSGTSMHYANVTVEDNYFERCNGEVECISNKSCGNTYRNNVFYEVSAGLVLRQGNNCVVTGNYFHGNHKPNTAGIRVVGENHVIAGNYLENLTGTDYYASLCVMRGRENAALYDYSQVKNLVFKYNTFVNCKQAMNISFHNDKPEYVLPPVKSVVEHNVIFNNDLQNIAVKISRPDLKPDITWNQNFYNEGLLVDFPKKDITVYPSSDFEKIVKKEIKDMKSKIKPTTSNTGVSWLRK